MIERPSREMPYTTDPTTIHVTLYAQQTHP